MGVLLGYCLQCRMLQVQGGGGGGWRVCSQLELLQEINYTNASAHLISVGRVYFYD